MDKESSSLSVGASSVF
jgi:hypothetical protein